VFYNVANASGNVQIWVTRKHFLQAGMQTYKAVLSKVRIIHNTHFGSA